MQVVIWLFFWRTQRGPAPYSRRSAMHRSKLDIESADAGDGGMSISYGSGAAGASGMGAPSSSSDAYVTAQSTTAQSTGSSGAGSSSMCLEKSSSWAWSAAASSTACLKWASLWHAVDTYRCTTPGFCRRGLWWSATHIWRGRLSAVMPCSSFTRLLIVSALRHKTSNTRMMCSLSRVMSAGDSKGLLPGGAARDAFRFQW